MTGIPEGLAGYLTRRQAQRDRDTEAAWMRLSAREQLLVREAAVMGYVQGVRAAGSTNHTIIPPDRRIVDLVLGSVPSFTDLYPTLAALFGDEGQ